MVYWSRKGISCCTRLFRTGIQREEDAGSSGEMMRRMGMDGEEEKMGASGEITACHNQCVYYSCPPGAAIFLSSTVIAMKILLLLNLFW